MSCVSKPPLTCSDAVNRACVSIWNVRACSGGVVPSAGPPPGGAGAASCSCSAQRGGVTSPAGFPAGGGGTPSSRGKPGGTQPAVPRAPPDASVTGEAQLCRSFPLRHSRACYAGAHPQTPRISQKVLPCRYQVPLCININLVPQESSGLHFWLGPKICLQCGLRGKGLGRMVASPLLCAFMACYILKACANDT